MAENTVAALVERIGALEEIVAAQTKQIEDSHATIVAQYAVVVEYLQAIQTTTNEAHTMATDMADTFKVEISPLLKMAQNHPLAKFAARKAARHG